MKRLLLSITFLSFLFIGSKNVDAQPIPGGGISPIITEIMYNPPESGNDTLEFVELYNPSTTANINLAGYYFSSGVEYTFPAGVTLAPGAYVLISGDSVVFEEWYGIESYEWTGGTALSNSGEGLTLRNAGGGIADTVFFDDTNAWPDADGTGYSLVLCDPSADNNLPESWTASENATGIFVATTPDPTQVFADPGAASTCTTVGVSEMDENQTLVFPNPSNGNFRVQFEASNETSLIRVYNTVGQVVFTESLAAGVGSIELNTGLKTGHYILSIENGNSIERLKLTVQ